MPINKSIYAASLVRPMTTNDLDLVLAWRNHDRVRHYMYRKEKISTADHAMWFERMATDAERHLLVYEAQGEPLGFINFHASEAARVANWGFYAAPEAPRGTGQQLGVMALEFAFGQLDLHKVCGQALAYNNRSINLHRRLGFVQEGVLRSQHFDGGSYHDIHHFGLLSHEWRVNA